MKMQSLKISYLARLTQATKLVFAGALVFAISLFGAGLYQFASGASYEANLDSLPKADGIVVLTGEGSRIHSGIELLEGQHGKRLLISGVSNKVSDKTVLNAYAPKATSTKARIDLDRMAMDTKGNAEHTARWAYLHGFKQVIVVTSSYHMPRSLEHLSNAMPSIELIPAQVIPSDLKGKSTLSMMLSHKVITEYVKLLLTKAQLEPVMKYMWTSLHFRTKS